MIYEYPRRHGAGIRYTVSVPSLNEMIRTQAATLLISAARDGHTDTVRRLLAEKRVDVNAINEVNVLYEHALLRER